MSENQAKVFFRRLFRDDQSNDAVMKSFNNKSHLHTMARVFSSHSQILCAVLENNGSNDFLSKEE